MHFGKSHLEDKREDLRSHYGKIEKTAGVTALRIAFCLLLVVLVCGTGLVIGAVRGVIDSAPDISEANIMPLGNASFIYDADGNQVQKLTGAQGNRVSISIEEIPLDMQHAIVAVEDARFYEHNGIDPSGIIRAFVVGVSHGFHFTEGASTITQQLLKNNVFTDWMEETRMQSFKRKIQEQYLALKLEKTLTAEGENAKDVILENYLNGHNIHRNLTQVHIRADSGCCSDSCCFQNILYHRHGKFPCSHLIGVQIIGCIYEYFINRVRENIFRSDVFQVNTVNLGTILQIVCHTRWCNDIINLQCRIRI